MVAPLPSKHVTRACYPRRLLLSLIGHPRSLETTVTWHTVWDIAVEFCAVNTAVLRLRTHVFIESADLTQPLSLHSCVRQD